MKECGVMLMDVVWNLTGAVYGKGERGIGERMMTARTDVRSVKEYGTIKKRM